MHCHIQSRHNYVWGILCTVYEEGGVSPAGSPSEDNNDEEVLGFVYSPDEKGHTDHSRESTHTVVVEGWGWVTFIPVCRSNSYVSVAY